ncbi:hypothetical protein IEZ26_15830 [Nocardioides cavernae]|uniref:RAMA domain-containing protein n=1 Tax=Nocardioides cavernae TaxID=1921566 RepID=A0ABR8ND80_9ACTN|nr:hypothetical protein [Nocardioides cavernae]MBD3926094.1 hypothetical protein [Nocardioides cavernae]MBM7513683.1 hypothetical protein [Nocardioides cavernae]
MVAMHRIEVDEEVYRFLEGHVRGFESPNTVLRRLLLPDAAVEIPQPEPTVMPGRLLPLIEAGLIKPGDSLEHRQVRKGRDFGAIVDNHGWTVTEVNSYREPSPALRDLVGSQIDGWANWTHVLSGKTLRELREELRKSASGE